jgi:hypothetical protein
MDITPEQLYKKIYKIILTHQMTFYCKTEQEASRIANKYAVQNTWKKFNQI